VLHRHSRGVPDPISAFATEEWKQARMNLYDEEDEVPVVHTPTVTTSALRDQIAQEMWNHYVLVVRERDKDRNYLIEFFSTNFQSLRQSALPRGDRSNIHQAN
jgi:hypothetical protein